MVSEMADTLFAAHHFLETGREALSSVYNTASKEH